MWILGWIFLGNQVHAQVSTLQNNCFGSAWLSAGLTSFLNSNFVWSWPTQNKCLWDIAVSFFPMWDLLSGNIIAYNVTVTNNGPRWSYSSRVAVTATNWLNTSTPLIKYGQMAPGTSQTQSLFIVKWSSTPSTATNAAVTFTLSDTSITDTNMVDNTAVSDLVVKWSTRVVCRAPGLTVPSYECEALMDLYDSTNGVWWISKTNWGLSPNIESWYGLATTVNDDLLAYYSFDNNNATDDAGNGTNWTLIWSPSFVAGKIGNAVNLNTTTQYISLGNNVVSNNMSFDAWIYRTSSAFNQWIIRKSSSYAFGIRNNKLSIVSMPWSAWIDTTTEVPMNQWVHVAFTYDWWVMRIYMNGEQVWSQNSSWSYVANSNPTTIWRDTANNRWRWGNLDNIHIYNRGLSAAEIMQLYQSSTLKENVRDLCLSNPSETTACNYQYQGTVGNNMLGPIPSSIGLLSELVRLSLNKNVLWGTIPAEITNLRKAKIILLASANLTGSLPSMIGNMSAMTDFDISNNTLQWAIPSSLSSTSIVKLRANSNSFTSLPNLSALNLQQLQISNNLLSWELPSWVGDQSSLYYINFSSNKFTGPIPPSWSSFSNLSTLFLRNNQLTGSLDVFSGLNTSNISTFQVQSNNLDRDHNNDAIVPANIQARLSSMTSQNLTNQWDITAPIITGTGNITPTIAWEFSYTITTIENSSTTGAGFSTWLSIFFTGSSACIQALYTTWIIANKLGNTMIQVYVLELGSFSGCKIGIVDRAWLVSNLVTLATFVNNDYGACNAAGDMIKSDCRALMDLYIATNGSNWINKKNWKGSGDASPTTACDWYGVQCTGNRVSWICLNGSWSSCNEIVTMGNNLIGQLPVSLANLTWLVSLMLQSNTLTGSVPAISSISTLKNLYLQNNQLSGPLPVFPIGIQNINLASNQFAWSMGDQRCTITLLSWYNLSSNLLNWSLSSCLPRFATGGTLDISSNYLNGALPLWSWSLGTILLNWNLLSWPIPSAWGGSFSALTKLSLASNNLQWLIPSSLTNLTNLSTNQSYLNNNCLSSSSTYISAWLLSTLNSKFNNWTSQKNCPGNIGSRVWSDTNVNWLRDAGETWPSGITVSLRRCTDQVSTWGINIPISYNGASVLNTTSSAWAYSFANINPGKYYLEYTNIPNWYKFTSQNVWWYLSSTNSDVNPWSAKTYCFELYNGLNEPNIDAGLINLPYSSCETTTPAYTPILVGQAVSVSVAGYGINAIIDISSTGNGNPALNKTYLTQTLTNQWTDWALKTWNTIFTPGSPIVYRIRWSVDGYTDRLEYYESTNTATAYRVVGSNQWCAVQWGLGPQITVLTTINQIAIIPSPLEYCTPSQNASLSYASVSNQPTKMLVKVAACESILAATTDFNIMCNNVTDIPSAQCKELVKLYDATEWWTWCAPQNSFCSFTGTRQVRYGVGWAYKTLSKTDGTSCNDSTFGDPVYGWTKQCRYRSDAGSWSNESKWRFLWDTTPRSVCDWYGITCAAGQVTSINLASNNLQRTLSWINWEVFSDLTTLELYDNSLWWPLPDISTIPALTTVRLGSNQFTGSLPTNWWLMPVVTELNLERAWLFTGTIPSSWTWLSDTLVKFNAGSILSLSGQAIPSWISQMINLQELYLYDNGFAGELTNQFSSLTKLKTLQIQSNNLHGNLQSIPLSALTQLYNSSYGWNKSAIDMNCLYTWMVSGTTGNFLNTRFNFASFPATDWRVQRYCNTDLELSTVTKVGNLMTGLTMTYIINYQNLWLIPSYEPQISITLFSGLYMMSGAANITTGNWSYYVALPSLMSGQTWQYSFTINKMWLGSWLYSIVNQFSLTDPYISDVNPSNNIFIDNDIARGSSYSICINPQINIQTYECEALWDLYAWTNGPNWTNKTNWMTNIDVETWFGITLTTIDNINYIQNICMATATDASSCQDNWLPGSIGNNLSGSLPPTVGDLFQLAQFRMPWNKIWWVIPWSFANLDKILSLDLNANKITSIGTGLGNMAALRELYLWDNPLLSIDAGISNAPMLTHLAFEKTKITVLPDLAWLCDTLKSLSIYENSLLQTTIPAWFTSCTKLQTFNAWSAWLNGTITDQFTMPSLQYLRVNNNNLYWVLPSYMSIWLIEFSANYNNFVWSLPLWRSSLANLQTLNLSYNTWLSSTLPDVRSGMVSMKSLNLSWATIQWQIPSSWFPKMTGMVDFIIPHTLLDWPIPVSWFQQWTFLNINPIKSTVIDNCMYTGWLTFAQNQWMNTFWSWNTQKRCTTDIQITLTSKSAPDYNPSKTISYVIDYANNWPRWAYESVVNVSLNTGIVISWTMSTTTWIRLPILKPGQTGQVIITTNKRGTGNGTGTYTNTFVISDPTTIDKVKLDGLISYYSFDDDTANDESSRGYHGTLMWGASFADGIAGRALSLDGIDDYVNIASNPYSNAFTSVSPDFTISAWIKTNRTNGPYESDSAWTIFGQRYGDSMVFGYWGGSTVRAGKLFLNIDDTRAWSPRSTSSVNDDTWKHVVVVAQWSGSGQGTATFYINGVQDTVSNWNATTTNQPFGFIGHDSRFLSYFSGLIDELSIYNRALSMSEVKQINDSVAQNTIIDTGVIKWFKYNECIDINDISQPECEALMDLYTFTDWPNWVNKTNWAWLWDATPTTACDWYGVSCSAGQVSRIYFNFPDNNLSGVLMSTIGDLFGLKDLTFSYQSKLRWLIPVEIMNITGLNILSLYKTSMSWPIPSSIGNLRNLKALSLRWWYRSWLNTWFSSPLPSWLFTLTWLVTLQLSDNYLTEQIPVLTWFDVLKTLLLRYNNFTWSLPNNWSTLSKLTDIAVQGNRLSWILPSSWGDMTSIQTIDLSLNQLTGSLPTSWSALTGLKDLRINNNDFTGMILPTSWSEMASLEYLDVWGSKLIGTLPSSWWSLNKLKTLRINSNKFYDDIPSWWFTGMTAMQNFIAYDNNLGWPIDVPKRQSWSNLSINGFDSVISNNCFYTGSVVWWYLSWMDTYFGAKQIKASSSWAPQYYWKNQKRCPADLELSGLVTLWNLYTWSFMSYVLNYSNNGISWSYVPTVSVSLHSGLELMSWWRVANIELWSLKPYSSGQIIISLKKVGIGSGVEVFTNTFAISDSLSDDLFTGNNTIVHTGLVKWFKYPICGIVQDIPQYECEALGDFYTDLWWSNWNNKTYWMGLWDPTDTTACDWFGVTCTTATDTSLAPKTVTQLCLWNPSTLWICNWWPWENGGLAGNNLSGSLPGSIADLTSIIKLNLSGNTKLIGQLPSNIGDLKKLEYLQFAYWPKLTGQLPASMSDLISVRTIALIDNKTFGILPTGLLDLPQLSLLWLNNNQLTGLLPATSTSPLGDFYIPNNPSLWWPMPSWFNTKTTFSWFRIWGTALSGTIPVFSANKLGHIDMSAMPNLRGELPSWWSSLPNINTIKLRSNPGLSGAILPSSWSTMTKLVEVSINSSSLTWSLPSSWSSLANLKVLRLNNNNLNGEIPASWSWLTALTNLVLRSNNLDWPIPIWLQTAYTSLWTNSSTLSYNCMYTGGVVWWFMTYMNSKFGANWQVQNTCTSDPALISLGVVWSLETGNSLVYSLKYTNNWPHRSYLPKISVTLHTWLAVGTFTGVYSTWLSSIAPYQSWFVYFVINKNNYTQMWVSQFTNIFTISDTTSVDTTISNNTLIHTGFVRGSLYPVCRNISLTVSQLECESLMDIYTSNGGISWTNKTNWGTQPDVWTWFGVTVTSGMVTKLRLSNSTDASISCNTISNGNNLIWSLNPSVRWLVNLTDLCLGNNALSWIFPTLNDLSALKTISLHHNNISSLASSLNNLVVLETVDFSYNILTWSLSSGTLNNLPLLKNLWLDHNQLIAGLTYITRYTNLQSIRLNDNLITGVLPSTLNSLAYVADLSIQNNLLDRDHENNAILPSTLTTWYNGITNKSRANQWDIFAPTISNLSPISGTINNIYFPISLKISENSYASWFYTKWPLSGQNLSGLFVTVLGNSLCTTISSDPIMTNSGVITVMLYPETDGVYSSCSITVSDRANNVSNSIVLSTFTYEQPPYRLHLTMWGSGVVLSWGSLNSIIDRSPFKHIITLAWWSPAYLSDIFNGNGAIQLYDNQSLMTPWIFRKQKFDNIAILMVMRPWPTTSNLLLEQSQSWFPLQLTTNSWKVGQDTASFNLQNGNLSLITALHNNWSSHQVRVNGTQLASSSASQPLQLNNISVTSIGSWLTQWLLWEIIVYTKSLNALSISYLESYLAIKYGITLPWDYTALVSNSITTIWNSNSTYQHQVVWLGHYTNSPLPLSQRTSKSSSGATVTLHANGTWSDGQYVMVGSNNWTLARNRTINWMTGYKLLDRTRYVKKTWSNPSFNISVTNESIAPFNYYPIIIVSNTPDFSTIAASWQLVKTSENVWISSWVTINNNQYVTFAVSQGSIGARVWLDSNRDGIQSPSEPSISWVKAKLWSCPASQQSTWWRYLQSSDISNSILLDEVTTNSTNTNALFSEIDPGNYYMTFDRSNAILSSWDKQVWNPLVGTKNSINNPWTYDGWVIWSDYESYQWWLSNSWSQWYGDMSSVSWKNILGLDSDLMSPDYPNYASYVPYASKCYPLAAWTNEQSIGIWLMHTTNADISLTQSLNKNSILNGTWQTFNLTLLASNWSNTSSHNTQVIVTIPKHASVSQVMNNGQPVSYILSWSLLQIYSATLLQASSKQYVISMNYDGFGDDGDVLLFRSLVRTTTLDSNQSNNIATDSALTLAKNGSSIGDRLWIDTNDDGIQNDIDGWTGGVIVELRKASDDSIVKVSKTTSSTGYYLFTSIQTGSYYIFVTNLPKWYTLASIGTSTSNSENDSNIDPTTNKSAVFTTHWVDDLSIDIGIKSVDPLRQCSSIEEHKLRMGYSYNQFNDSYSTSSIRWVRLFEVKRTWNERADYNTSEVFPSISLIQWWMWSPPLPVGYLLPSTMKQIIASDGSPYAVTKRPQQRWTTWQMIISYEYLGCLTMSSLPNYCLKWIRYNSCHTYEITSCGDGIVDKYTNQYNWENWWSEECDFWSNNGTTYQENGVKCRANCTVDSERIADLWVTKTDVQWNVCRLPTGNDGSFGTGTISVADVASSQWGINVETTTIVY